MPPRGWYARYADILAEFRYSRSDDEASARLLDTMLKGRPVLGSLRKILVSKDVFVVGAGPSLGTSIKIMRQFPKIIRIVSDGAVLEMVRQKMRIDVIVSDLDGDESSLYKASRLGTIMIIHAHGDNVNQLKMVYNFKKIIGTTQSHPTGQIQNFGGFTDGDRCVFIAAAMHVKSITLLGMDFGSKVGKYSMTSAQQMALKRKKLRHAKALLEWIAPSISKSLELYTTTRHISGFKFVTASDLDIIFK